MHGIAQYDATLRCVGEKNAAGRGGYSTISRPNIWKGSSGSRTR